jgi:hypothetical protein
VCVSVCVCVCARARLAHDTCWVVLTNAYIRIQTYHQCNVSRCAGFLVFRRKGRVMGFFFHGHINKINKLKQTTPQPLSPSLSLSRALQHGSLTRSLSFSRSLQLCNTPHERGCSGNAHALLTERVATPFTSANAHVCFHSEPSSIEAWELVCVQCLRSVTIVVTVTVFT